MGGDGICTNEFIKLAGDAIADNQVSIVLKPVVCT
jgi:hypothetical protein